MSDTGSPQHGTVIRCIRSFLNQRKDASVRRNRLMLFLFTLLSLAVYVVLSYFTIREDFVQVIALYSSALLLYFFWYRLSTRHNILTGSLIAAMLLRAALLFSLPNLSDDFYRFIWDGRLTGQGINPFAFLPSELLNSTVANVDMTLYENLNSKEYYSVYPPLSQLVFFLAAILSPDGLLGSVVIMKAFIAGFELGTILITRKLLRDFQMNENLVLLYALNPLAIVELTGNLHFEAAMIFFCVLSVFLITRDWILLSAATFSAAVCVKLLPLLFVPFFYKRFFKAEGNVPQGIFRYAAWLCVIFIFSAGCFIPFWFPGMPAKIGSSVNLYFQHFEFNGSIFYIIRWIGFQWKGYDVVHSVGPWLAGSTALIMLFYFLFERKPSSRSIFLPLLLSLATYLLLATTVHPWYITPLILFCVFTPLRFPLIWSAFIPLTYIAYSSVPVEENAWLIALEYSSFILFGVAEFLYARKNGTLQRALRFSPLA